MKPTGQLRADAERNVRSIIDAAIVLLAAEPDASMERVAQAAGVGRATVYRHFASREHLVRAIHDRALQDARDAVLSCRLEEGAPLEALGRGISAILRVADRYRLLRAIPREDGELRARAAELGAPLVALFERAQRDGEMRTDLPARWMAATLGSVVQAVTLSIIEGDVPERDATQLVLTTLVDGFGARP